MDEGGAQGRLEQGLGGLGGRLHEIAEHAVVADFQGHAAFEQELGLQGRDHPAAVVAKLTGLIQFRTETLGDKAAVPDQGRQFGAQALAEGAQQSAELRGVGESQGVQRRGDLGGRAVQRLAHGGEQGANLLPRQQTGSDGAKVSRAAASKT